MNKVYYCEACGSECEPVDIECGGWEEFWGAKVWHSQITTVSGCCHENYEELDGDQDTEHLRNRHKCG